METMLALADQAVRAAFPVAECVRCFRLWPARWPNCPCGGTLKPQGVGGQR